MRSDMCLFLFLFCYLLAFWGEVAYETQVLSIEQGSAGVSPVISDPFADRLFESLFVALRKLSYNVVIGRCHYFCKRVVR